MSEIRLFSYKMTDDTGFAPFPFGGFLTLATCKPGIRETKKIGDWIAGFTSKDLNNDPVGEERLVYLMQVNDKISFAEYWKNPKYNDRKPNIRSKNILEKIGDNIYKPVVKNPKNISDFDQVPNLYHEQKNKKIDLSSKYVLISKRFYYFGCECIELRDEIRPKVPKTTTYRGVQTHNIEKAEKFISFIESSYKTGIHNHPTSWFKNDVSWKKDENYIES
jgi:hypothetical protein